LVEIGQTFFVSGRTSECTWLQVVLDDGSEGWVSGGADLVRLNLACSTIPLPVNGETQALLTPIRTPTATAVRVAIATATQQNAAATPTATTAPLPTATPDLSNAGPQSVTILSPADGHNGLAPVVFSWVPDAPLASGQEFEVVFWNAASETEQQGRGWVRSSTESEVRIDPSRQASGSYRWGVYVVATDPYRRIRFLGLGYAFVVPGESGGGGSGGGNGGRDPSDEKP
jgi:hypothetical protein